MTYTIAASVPERRLLGVATASRSLAVGAGVLAIRAGVGAVASQAYTNRSLRRYALDRLERGDAPQEIVDALSGIDPNPELRQFAVIDAAGRHASRTGAECSEHADARESRGAVLVGNLLAGPAVLPAMLEAYETGGPARSSGELAERLLRSLEAGEAAGGDVRGRQSAALLVAHEATNGSGLPADDIDLRVDDHADPVAELRRLTELHLGRP